MYYFNFTSGGTSEAIDVNCSSPIIPPEPRKISEMALANIRWFTTPTAFKPILIQQLRLLIDPDVEELHTMKTEVLIIRFWFTLWQFRLHTCLHDRPWGSWRRLKTFIVFNHRENQGLNFFQRRIPALFSKENPKIISPSHATCHLQLIGFAFLVDALLRAIHVARESLNHATEAAHETNQDSLCSSCHGMADH